MSSLMEAVAVAAISAIIGVLVVAKADSQFSDMLEGKAYKLGKDRQTARQCFLKQKRPIDALILVLGIVIMAVALVATHLASAAGWLGGGLGLALTVAGVIGRLKSFRKADDELGG